MLTLTGKDPSATLAEREAFIHEIKSSFPQHYVYLQTCDRVELYSGDGRIPKKIARHLFRVTAGLESPLLGETAIQGQVKQAYLRAQAEGHVSPGLHRLFQTALRAGKQVRAETGISRGAMSHSQAVIEILKQKKVNLTGAKILVLGANRLNKKVLQYLARAGNKTTFLSSRSYDKAVALSQELGCNALRFDKLKAQLSTTDILITATSAPRAIIHYTDFPKKKPMLIFDLAVPRDVEEAIGNLPHVELFNIEQIESALTANLKKRQTQTKKAERIIDELYKTI